MSWGESSPAGIKPRLHAIPSCRRLLRLGLAVGWVLLLAPAGQAGILDLAWDAPTTNADGTPLTDLSGYRVYSGLTSLLTACPPASPPQVVASATPSPSLGTVVTHQLTGLTDGTIYFVRVTAVDTSGNESGCSNEAFAAALPDPLDTTPPTASISAPSTGAFLRGPVTVTVAATDNVGVASVEFYLDSILQVPATTSPFSWSWNTTTATNGAHTLTAIARDAAGNFTTSSPVAVTVDNSPPTVTITAPTGGQSVSGTVPVTASALDNSGVVGVQFQVDGTTVGPEDATNPYNLSWNTTPLANGSHTLTAIARDAAGNAATSAPVAVTVANGDFTAPTVSIVTPTSGSTVAGTITVAAAASDNVGVSGVQFRLDGANLGAEVTVAPYTLAWNTAIAANGAHTLTAVARDAVGNVTTSVAVTVTVANDTTPPTVSITAPAAAATVAGTISLSASATDTVGVVGVQFKLDGANFGAEVTVAPYSVAWNTTTAVNGAHTLTAVARDAAGNLATSAAVSVTVANDTTPPAVSTTAPLAGTTVAGVVSVAASASDNVGVAGVQFRLDGANLGAEVTVAPYTLAWNTAIAANGAHTLTAVARDAAGNLATSAQVGVTVANTSSIVNPTTGLAAYWKLDEGTGTTAMDSSGNSNTGTLVNGPAWIVGKLGQALAFNGLTTSVRVPSTAALNAYPLTIAFWMKTPPGGGGGAIVNKYVAASLNGYQVFMSSGNLCAWYFKDALNYVWDGTGCTLATPGYADGLWHHVVFVVDASGGRLYVDGALKATQPWTGAPGATSTIQPLRLGVYPSASGGWYFSGSLDEVQIYGRALSATELLGQ